MQRHGHPIVAIDATVADDARADPEGRLWREVIMQAFRDAQKINHRNSERLDAQRARDWLFVDGRDFTDVCELAGLDPDVVRRGVRRKLH